VGKVSQALTGHHAIIAATVLEANVTALVSNDPHFNRIEGLKVLTLSDLVPQEV